MRHTTPLTVTAGDADSDAALSELFKRWPILVEVRFPRSGTSPDWHLVEDREELTAVLDGLASGVELSLTSVWDLDDQKVRLRLRK